MKAILSISPIKPQAHHVTLTPRIPGYRCARDPQPRKTGVKEIPRLVGWIHSMGIFYLGQISRSDSL